VAAVLALAGTASADIGDFDVFGDPQGTATAAEITGQITCTTTIGYGLVLHVAQNPAGAAYDDVADSDGDTRRLL
jgi:hypothetical protein